MEALTYLTYSISLIVGAVIVLVSIVALLDDNVDTQLGGIFGLLVGTVFVVMGLNGFGIIQ